ncbi:hypothetical protein Tco_1418738 [Tanacetum coccineum]
MPCWQSLTIPKYLSMAEIDSKEAQKKLKAGICFRISSHNKHTLFCLYKETQKKEVEGKKTSAINKAFCKPLRHVRIRHEDKDHDPPAGSDQRMKKRRTGKDVEPSMKSSKSKEFAKGKTQSNTFKTGKSVSADKSAKEPEHVVPMDDKEPNLDNVANDADETQTPDPDWNTVKSVDDAPEQSWFKEMIQAEKPPLTFDELMSTLIDFNAFAMNRLKLDTITRADLVSPVFKLLKGTYKSCVELEKNMEECYRALTNQLDWTNPKGHKSLVDMCNPLSLQDKEGRLTIPVEFFFNNDLEYLKVGNSERTYSSFITKTSAARYTMEGIEYFISTLWSLFTIAYDKDVVLEISY